MTRLSNFPENKNTERIVYVKICWQAAGAYQLLKLHLTLFNLNAEAFVHWQVKFSSAQKTDALA